MTPTPTFTTFCTKGNDNAGMAVQAVQAGDRKQASEMGMAKAAEGWGCSVSEVQCRGVYPGDITVLNWD